LTKLIIQIPCFNEEEYLLKTLNDLPKKYLEDVELMRKATNQPNLRPIVLCYMGENVRNDSETMINIVNNCDERYFDFADFRMQDDVFKQKYYVALLSQ
jgi:hypothetical protein